MPKNFVETINTVKHVAGFDNRQGSTAHLALHSIWDAQCAKMLTCESLKEEDKTRDAWKDIPGTLQCYVA